MNVPRPFDPTDCACSHAALGFEVHMAVAIAAGHAQLIGVPLSPQQLVALEAEVRRHVGPAAP